MKSDEFPLSQEDKAAVEEIAKDLHLDGAGWGGVPGYYRLAEDGETPVRIAGTLEWAKWYEYSRKRGNNVVRQVHYRRHGIERFVSTVFLSLDHNWFEGGDPILWETMVFGRGWESLEMDRYSSRRDALAGHMKAFEEMREAMNDLLTVHAHKRRARRRLAIRLKAMQRKRTSKSALFSKTNSRGK